MKLNLIPGWLLLAALAWGCNQLSRLITIGGKHPIEASVLAVVVGILLNSLLKNTTALKRGVAAYERLLVLGIVLMGASLNFSSFLDHSTALLAIIIITMLAGFFGTYAIAILNKLSFSMSMLLASGTTICGGTAVAIIAPIVKAKHDETGYVISVITLWGVAALIAYPLAAHWLSIDDVSFGVFAGTAIHSTPQVVGAGFAYSDQAGQTATAVKLVRNCMIAPLAFGIALWMARRERMTVETSGSPDVTAAFPWFLFVFFVMSWCATGGYFTPQGIAAFESAGKFLIVAAMAGVGLNMDISAIRRVGYVPLLTGLLGAFLVATISSLLIMLLLLP